MAACQASRVAIRGDPKQQRGIDRNSPERILAASRTSDRLGREFGRAKSRATASCGGAWGRDAWGNDLEVIRQDNATIVVAARRQLRCLGYPSLARGH